MSNGDSSTISFQMTQYTQGYPAAADENFTTAIQKGKQGGPATQAYFDALNQTSDFWNWMANMNNSGENAWVPGTNPQGMPIFMSSNGNIQMETVAFYQPVNGSSEVTTAPGDSPPIVGIATIRTGNTTNQTSQTVSFTIGLVGVPVGILLSQKLFAALLSPIYTNLKTLIGKYTSTLQEASQVESPSVDPEEEAEPVLEEQSTVADAGEEAAELGVEYIAIDWTTTGLAVAGLGVLAAIPIVIEFLAHQMTHFIQINNMTDADFNWEVAYQDSGKFSVQPSSNTIPAMSYYTDMWGDKSTVKCAYQANLTAINSSDLGSLGYVLTLTGGDQTASLVVSVPWAGTNTIWLGPPASSGQATYEQHFPVNNQTTMAATFGDYTITITINQLSGKVNGQYAYSSLVTIEQPTS